MTALATASTWAAALQVPGDAGDPGTGLTNEARVLVALLGVGALGFILVLLRRRQLRPKYALVWTGVGVALGVLGLFPGLLTGLADAVGIYYPPALFLLVTVGFLLAVVIQFSWELSRLQDRSRVLAEELALLRAELEGKAPLAPPPDDDPSSQAP